MALDKGAVDGDGVAEEDVDEPAALTVTMIVVELTAAPALSVTDSMKLQLPTNVEVEVTNL